MPDTGQIEYGRLRNNPNSDRLRLWRSNHLIEPAQFWHLIEITVLFLLISMDFQPGLVG